MCYSPFPIKNGSGEEELVPCGKCAKCVSRRVSSWSFRLMKEDRRSTTGYFITLTYDTKHVPITKRGFMTINKRDCQLFLKRLRKAQTHTRKIKYFLAAEYGTDRMRPHYHLILFNADLPTIDPAWNLGIVHYGDVSGASIGYTLKYMSKPPQIPIHRNDDRTREFRLMSKGMGANYLTPQMAAWHYADLLNRMYCTLDDGRKISMPRYYKDKLYTDEQREAISIHAQERIYQETVTELTEHHGDWLYWHNKKEDAKAANRVMLQMADHGKKL